MTTTLAMGINLIPIAPKRSAVPRGKTHSDSDPCPFTKDDSLDSGATCCSFRIYPVTTYLGVLGFWKIGVDFQRKKTPAQTRAFGKKLRLLATTTDQLLADIERIGPDPNAAEYAQLGGLDPAWKETLIGFGEALTSAADWHERVGGMGFGIEAP